MAPTTATAIGVALSKEHAIGKLIGQGAFGYVHAVTKGKTETEWACKLTPLPVKKSRKGDSVAEVAYMRLWSEYLLYSQHLRHLGGSVLPKLPSANTDGLVLYHDNRSGFRCLIMERMQLGLFDALPMLVTASTKTVNLGAVCSKLLDIVEEIHKTGHILLDVKPDNLMVCVTKNKSTTPEAFAASIRLVDLGLVKSYGGMRGHKENVGVSDVQGTPLYASLNVHDLQTPSRRDDVESMIYLIGDLVLNVNGIANNIRPPYGSGTRASYLPWSQETSDSAIGEMKKTQVSDRGSAYYQSMPKPAAAALYAAYQVVRDLKYASAPNYETFRRLFRPLQVKKLTKKEHSSTAASKSVSLMRDVADEVLPLSHRSPRRPRPSSGEARAVQPRRSTRSSEEAALDDNPLPPKLAKTSTRYKVDEVYSDSDVSMEDADHDSVSKGTSDDMLMDVDADCKKPAVKTLRGIKLVVKWQGVTEFVKLVEGGTDSIVIGSKPEKINDKALTLLDSKLAASHVRITLSKFHNGVQVDPSSKKCIVQVNRMNVPASGTTAFVGQVIGCGGYYIEVQNLRKDEFDQVESDENCKPAAKTKKTAFRGIKLDIKGRVFSETVMLIEGGTECVVLGKSPVHQSDGDELVILQDPTLLDSHACLTLSRSHEGVHIQPLLKKCVVKVNRMPVPFSGMVALVNQEIIMGETTVIVSKLGKSDVAESAADMKLSQNRRSSRTTRAMTVADANATDTSLSGKKKCPTEKKFKSRPHRAIVKITAGSLSGKEYVLEQGVCDSIVIGSEPTRKGHRLVLESSKGQIVSPNHTRLELLVKDDVVMVKVTDLKSEGGTFFNGKRITSGKTEMAFCGSASIQIGDAVLQILRG